MVQERLPAAAPAAGLPGGEQLPDDDTMPGVVGVERRQRRQLAIHRRRAHVRLDGRQHRNHAVPARLRQRQPGHELADVLQPRLPPVQPPAGKEDPEILQVMGVGLDRVRGPLDVGQVGQVPLHWPDRDVVVPDDGPRLCPRAGHRHALNMHRFLHLIHVMDKGGDNHIQHADPGGSGPRAGRGGQPAEGSR
jgi:hypothetical protein